MKLLQLCQKYFSMLGINSNKLEQTENYNKYNLLSIPVFVSNIVLYSVFIFQEVNSFVELMFSIYMTSAMICLAAGLAAIGFRTRKFIKFINTMEQKFEESE